MKIVVLEDSQNTSLLPKFNKKYEREEEKGRERKFWISATWIPKFLLSKTCYPGAQMETNCGNTIAEIGKKNCGNCGNGIAENGKKKLLLKFGEELKKRC